MALQVIWAYQVDKTEWALRQSKMCFKNEILQCLFRREGKAPNQPYKKAPDIS